MPTKLQSNQLNIETGWYYANEVWTYASATTITVPSGAATKYSKGDRIKLTQTTIKYFYIIGVADTLLTITAGTSYTLVNAAISNNYYSHEMTPVGFPEYMNYAATVSTVGGGTAPTYTASDTNYFSIYGNMCYVQISKTNSSGGVAGSGTNLLVIDFPILPINTTLGFGTVYESGGTGINALAIMGSSTYFYMRSASYVNMTANDQSSVSRVLQFSLIYPI